MLIKYLNWYFKENEEKMLNRRPGITTKILNYPLKLGDIFTTQRQQTLTQGFPTAAHILLQRLLRAHPRAREAGECGPLLCSEGGVGFCGQLIVSTGL